MKNQNGSTISISKYKVLFHLLFYIQNYDPTPNAIVNHIKIWSHFLIKPPNKVGVMLCFSLKIHIILLFLFTFDLFHFILNFVK